MSKNGLFRLQDNTPEAYTNESRDFQLFLRLYDCVNNGTKFYIDSILDSVDTKTISSSLLGLLRTKLGFFNETEFTERELRYILRGFPYLIKDKGSKRAIDDAVYIFMNAKGMSVPHKIDIDNGLHVIHIDIESALEDTKMLDVMLSFVIPTGYTYDINFYSPQVLTGGFDYRSHGYMLDVTQNQYTGVVRGRNSDHCVFEDDEVYNRSFGYAASSVSTAHDEFWVSFTPSETAPHLYQPYAEKSWTATLVSNEWAWVEDQTPSLTGVRVLGYSSSGPTWKPDPNQNPVHIYTSTQSWSNYPSSVVGTIGASVTGSNDEDSGTFEVRGFSDNNGGENE